MKTITRYRSAITGKFVTRAFAKANPDTTVAVTIRIAPGGDKCER